MDDTQSLECTRRKISLRCQRVILPFYIRIFVVDTAEREDPSRVHCFIRAIVGESSGEFTRWTGRREGEAAACRIGLRLSVARPSTIEAETGAGAGAEAAEASKSTAAEASKSISEASTLVQDSPKRGTCCTLAVPQIAVVRFRTQIAICGLPTSCFSVDVIAYQR